MNKGNDKLEEADSLLKKYKCTSQISKPKLKWFLRNLEKKYLETKPWKSMEHYVSSEV